MDVRTVLGIFANANNSLFLRVLQNRQRLWGFVLRRGPEEDFRLLATSGWDFVNADDAIMRIERILVTARQRSLQNLGNEWPNDLTHERIQAIVKGLRAQKCSRRTVRTYRGPFLSTSV